MNASVFEMHDSLIEVYSSSARKNSLWFPPATIGNVLCSGAAAAWPDLQSTRFGTTLIANAAIGREERFGAMKIQPIRESPLVPMAQ
jgi:hypothetical protein